MNRKCGKKESVGALLVGGTSLEAQRTLFTLWRNAHPTKWQSIHYDAVSFLKQFCPSFAVLTRLLSITPLQAVPKFGLDFQFEVNAGRTVLRNVVTVFEHDQE